MKLLFSGFLTGECVKIFENFIFGVSRGGLCKNFWKSYFRGFPRGKIRFLHIPPRKTPKIKFSKIFTHSLAGNPENKIFKNFYTFPRKEPRKLNVQKIFHIPPREAREKIFKKIYTFPREKTRKLNLKNIYTFPREKTRK